MFRLYDTRTRKAEQIEAARRGELRIYTCGPTVYRYAHVGNLRSYLLADLIRRTAQRHRWTDPRQPSRRTAQEIALHL